MLADMLGISIKNMNRQRSRSTLTVLGIAIGVASVVMISSIGQIGTRIVNNELESLGIGGLMIHCNKKIPSAELSDEHLELIRTSGSVDSAIPIVIDYTKTFMRELTMDAVVWGIDYGANQVIAQTPLHGRLITKNDVLSKKKICVVDQNIAQAYYKRDNIVGKIITLQFASGNEEFEIVGIVASGGDLMQGLMGSVIPSFVYIPYSTMQDYTGKNGFDQIAVQIKQGIDTDIAGAQLISSLQRASGITDGYQAENMRTQQKKLNRILDTVTVILSLVAGISLIVSGLSIMTMMLVSVHERTREIGIKKSIGANRRNILVEFILEAFLLSLTGSILGCAAGVMLVVAGGLFFHIQIFFNPPFLIFCILFSICVGVIFGAYPAMIASKLKPMEALRYE